MNKFNKSFLFLIIPVLFVSGGCKKEKSNGQQIVPGYIAGTVKNTFNEPLSGAIVMLMSDNTLTVRTGESGYFLFEKLPWRTYSLSVSLNGYISQSKNISIASADTSRVDFVMQLGTAVTQISDSLLIFPYTGGSKSILIKSNTSWTVTDTSGWITCNHSSGHGNGTLLFTCQKNTGAEFRSYTIKVNDGTREFQIVVHQGYQILLTGSTFTPGNGITSEKDSVTLTFNQPIRIVELTNLQQTCYQQIYPRYLGDSSSIRFNYQCGRLGGEYQIGYTVTDRYLNAQAGTATVRFYSYKLNLPGKIMCCYITDDNNTCWVGMVSPGRLLEVSMGSHTVIRTISVPYNPSKICMNPWDQKLYVIATDPMQNHYDSVIHVINPVTGNSDRNIPFRRDQYDNPQSPTIFPYALQFTNSGYGAALLLSNGSTALRWKVIDCAHNDSISIHPTWFTNYDYHDFRNLFVSFDKEKIMMTSNNYDCNIALLDGNSHNIDLLVPPVVSYGNFLRPNRLNGNIWLGQAYEQYILHPDHTASTLTHIDLENYPGADYSYKTNEPEVMYVCADNILNIIDYSSGNTIKTTDILYGLQGVTTTTNGEQIIMVRSASDNSDLLFFSSSIFNTNKK
jgi:hypothetical protein